MKRELLIFGGTFNPIHNAHIDMLKLVKKCIKPYKILVIPTNITSHKENKTNASPRDRFNMCRLAFENECNVEVSDVEIKRQGISYTVDTLKQIKEQYKNFDLIFTVGADMLADFFTWKNPEEILSYATICAVPRSELDFDFIKEQKKLIEEKFNNAKILLIKDHVENITSTQIRENIKQGKSIEKLVPKNVMDYIVSNNLYR